MNEKINKYKLHGPVKSVLYTIDTISLHSDSSIDDNSNLNLYNFFEDNDQYTELHFNHLGLLTKKENAEGTLIFIYDELNNKKEIKIFSIGNIEKPDIIVKFSYNINGLPNEIRVLNFVSWEYDENSEYVEVGAYLFKISQLPTSTSVYTYTYNDFNQLIEIRRYDDELLKNCYHTLYNTYDSKFNLIKQVLRHNQESICDYSKFYKYTFDNLLLMKQWANVSSIGIGNTGVTTNEFDSNKVNLVEYTEWYHNKSGTVYHYEYNDFKDVVSIKIEEKDLNEDSIKIKKSTLINYKYQYDLYGNWIKKQKIADEKLIETEVRTIAYY